MLAFGHFPAFTAFQHSGHECHDCPSQHLAEAGTNEVMFHYFPLLSFVYSLRCFFFDWKYCLLAPWQLPAQVPTVKADKAVESRHARHCVFHTRSGQTVTE